MKIQLGFQPEDFTMRTWRGRDGSPDTPNFDDQVGRHLMGESGRDALGLTESATSYLEESRRGRNVQRTDWCHGESRS